MTRSLTTLTTLALLAAPALAQDTKPTSKPTSRPSDAPQTLALGHAVDASISLQDIDGKPHSMADFKGRVTVVNFWSTKCPIQQGWEPTLAKIQRDYAAKGVTFLMINSNEANGEIADKMAKDDQKPYQSIRGYLKEKDLPYKVLVDHGSVVADRFGAKTTPDIYVFGKDAKLVYRGLIDDDPRGNKGDDTTHHLRDALDALIAGKDFEAHETKPHGCTIKRAKKTVKKKAFMSGNKRGKVKRQDG